MSSAVLRSHSVTDRLEPVCASVVGPSCGRVGEQRACVRLWVLLLCLTLKRPVACVTCMPNYYYVLTKARAVSKRPG